MGYNTTIFILNDNLDRIQRNPEAFVKAIVHDMHSGNKDSYAQTTVMQTGHADVPRLYFSRGNLMVELSRWNVSTLGDYAAKPFWRDILRNDIKVAKRMISDLEAALDQIDQEDQASGSKS